jgi:hypothetical protein
MAGLRRSSNGSLDSEGSIGYYWSSTVSGTSPSNLYIDSSSAFVGSSFIAIGFSVRCLKD